jgi:LysR family transcriptional regulator, hca operon transcriptional activator
MPDLEVQHQTSEPLVVVLPGDHRLAMLDVISPRYIERETFVDVSSTAPTLRVVSRPLAVRRRRFLNGH